MDELDLAVFEEAFSTVFCAVFNLEDAALTVRHRLSSISAPIIASQISQTQPRVVRATSWHGDSFALQRIVSAKALLLQVSHYAH